MEELNMKKGLTEMVFIIDKSGSMEGLEKDTIGGFNSMLKEQQAVEGEAIVTTVLFNNRYELLHDRIDIRAVSPLTEKNYTVGGNTALLDALGKTIRKIRDVQEHTAENYRAEKVLFIIITDGEENASREYSAERIKTRIEHQKQKYGWEFVFFGANMDAVLEAGKLGISAEYAQNYRADASGTSIAYTAMSSISTAYRGGNSSLGGMAIDNLKKAVSGAKGATDELVDFVGDIFKATEKNDGKMPNVNDIARQVLENELKKLEENSGNEARINELRDILKQ